MKPDVQPEPFPAIRYSGGSVSLAAAQKQDPAEGAANSSNGRWQLNAGSMMVGIIDGLNLDRWGYPDPVHLIIDMESVSFAADVLPALREHAWWGPIGRWENLEANASGIFGDLTLYASRNDKEAQMESFKLADEVVALQKYDHPWQASVTASPGEDGFYEEIEPGAEFTVNGQTITAPTDDLPTYVLRGGVVREASVVLFGADDQTGQIAAARMHPGRNKQQKGAIMASKLPGLPAAVAAKVTDEMDQDGVLASIAENTSLNKERLKALLDDDEATDDEQEELAEALGVDAEALTTEPAGDEGGDTGGDGGGGDGGGGGGGEGGDGEKGGDAELSATARLEARMGALEGKIDKLVQSGSFAKHAPTTNDLPDPTGAPEPPKTMREAMKRHAAELGKLRPIDQRAALRRKYGMLPE